MSSKSEYADVWNRLRAATSAGDIETPLHLYWRAISPHGCELRLSPDDDEPLGRLLDDTVQAFSELDSEAVLERTAQDARARFQGAYQRVLADPAGWHSLNTLCTGALGPLHPTDRKTHSYRAARVLRFENGEIGAAFPEIEDEEGRSSILELQGLLVAESAGEGVPEGITAADVRQAAADYDGGVEHGFRASLAYDVLIGKRAYPPKAVVGLAARRLAGRTLRPAEFNAYKAVAVLKQLGFRVVSKSQEPVDGGDSSSDSWRSQLWAQFRRLASEAGSNVQLPVYWKGRPDLRFEATLVGNQLHARVTEAVIALLEGIPDSYRESQKPSHQKRWDRAVMRVRENRGKTVTLNSLGSALLRPLEQAPPWLTNAYWSFYVNPSELEGLLTEEQLAALEQEYGEGTPVRLKGLGLFLFPKDGVEDSGEIDDVELEVEETSVWLRHRNVIFFGPPGTGKSHQLQEVVSEHLGAGSEHVLRVTFHPEFSYYDLVGSFRPTVGWLRTSSTFIDADGVQGDLEPRTYYRFEPGPLSRAIELAARTADPVVLIVEEINRGNCAAIFGDVFQLLDRRTGEAQATQRGWSQYAIQPSSEWADWLDRHVPPHSEVFDHQTRALRLPGNLYLYATMNTSDQSLFPMDTAFRRRWGMEYFGVDRGGDWAVRVPLHHKDSDGVPWLRVMRLINRAVVAHTRVDDKQLGPYYVRPPAGETLVDAVEFKSKVLFYLWSSVFRDSPGLLFHQSLNTYEAVAQRYDAGKAVFRDSLMSELLPVGDD